MKEKCFICKKQIEVSNVAVYKIEEKYIVMCCECNNCICCENKIDYNDYLILKNIQKKEYYEQYKKNNKEKQKQYQKKYRENHKEELKEIRKEYKEYYKNYNKKYREKNREQLNKKAQEKRKIESEIRRKKKREKLEQERLLKGIKHNEKDLELEKIKKRTRCLINKCFVRKGYKKGTKTERILGCNFETFNKHLLNTYKNNYGINWDYVDEVDIDHIVPLKSAKTEQEVIELCHYTNLQLLKRKDNKIKSAKMYNCVDNTTYM